MRVCVHVRVHAYDMSKVTHANSVLDETLQPRKNTSYNPSTPRSKYTSYLTCMYDLAGAFVQQYGQHRINESPVLRISNNNDSGTGAIS